jgi:Pyridoxamine 5'-phosphate oxidase
LIQLTNDMKRSINGALIDRMPVVVSYVDSEGQPHISFRGTAQAYSDDQLAVWIRNPDGGILRGIETNPRVALLYRNPAERKGWQFLGRARRDDDESVRQTVFDNSPQFERSQDPERKGVAVIIDLDRVIARGEVLMERDN